MCICIIDAILGCDVLVKKIEIRSADVKTIEVEKGSVLFIKTDHQERVVKQLEHANNRLNANQNLTPIILLSPED